jgi:hypothetical protein
MKKIPLEIGEELIFGTFGEMKQFTVVNFMQLQRKDSLKQRLNISSIYG